MTDQQMKSTEERLARLETQFTEILAQQKQTNEQLTDLLAYANKTKGAFSLLLMLGGGLVGLSLFWRNIIAGIRGLIGT